MVKKWPSIIQTGLSNKIYGDKMKMDHFDEFVETFKENFYKTQAE